MCDCCFLRLWLACSTTNPLQTTRRLNPGLLDNNQTIVEDTQPTFSSPSSTPSSCSTRYWENRLIFDSCFNPYDNGSFIENFTQVQGPLDSFPGGYLHLFAAAMPSGLKPVGDMPGLLKEDDLLAIKLELYKLPASKRNFVVSSSLLSYSSSSSSSSSKNLSSSDFLFGLAAIWYDRDSKRIWVPENTVKNWYAHEGSETSAQQPQNKRTRDPQKQFEEFWMRFVKSWEYCCLRWGYAPDMQKVSSSFQLCFRDRDGNGSSSSQGSSAFSDSPTSSPSPSSSEKGWTMVEDDSASS